MLRTALLVVTLLCTPALNAAQLELALGHCEIYQQDTGTWWLGDQYEAGRMSSACGAIGLAFDLRRRGDRVDGVRLFYADLGRPTLHETASGGPGPQPHWIASGSGELDAIGLGMYRRWNAGLRPELEGGLLFYRTQWHAAALHNASGKTNTFSTEPRHGVSFYLGAGLARELMPGTEAFVSVRWYAFLRSNNLEAAGDYVGPRYAHPVAFTIGVRHDF